jgi:hypothetical protein
MILHNSTYFLFIIPILADLKNILFGLFPFWVESEYLVSVYDAWLGRKSKLLLVRTPRHPYALPYAYIRYDFVTINFVETRRVVLTFWLSSYSI